MSASHKDRTQAYRILLIVVGLLCLTGMAAAETKEPSRATTLVRELRSTTLFLKLREDDLAAHPDSAEAQRGVAAGLYLVARCLEQRGNPGDAEAALHYYERNLELREKVMAANADSAQDARDVSWSLNTLGDFLVKRGKPGDVQAALHYYERSLDMREKLLAANPDSVAAARDVWLSSFGLGIFATKTGQGDALAWDRRAFEVLEGMEQRGMVLSVEEKGMLKVQRAMKGRK